MVSLLLPLVLYSITECSEFRRRTKPICAGEKSEHYESGTQFSLPMLPYTLLWHTCFLCYSPSTLVSPNKTLINLCFVEINLFYLYLRYILWTMSNVKKFVAYMFPLRIFLKWQFNTFWCEFFQRRI